MSGAQVRCSHCETLLPAQAASDWTPQACAACGESQQALVFPAVNGLRFSRPRDAEAAEGRALCFFHAEKPATVPCDLCGRFLCDLCDLAFEGGHYCSACLAAAQEGDVNAQGKAVAMMKERVFLPQNLALFLSFYLPLSLVGLYFVPFTAPAAIYISIRNWNRKDGVQMQGRWRFVACILFSLVQIAVTVFVVYALIKALRAGSLGS